MTQRISMRFPADTAFVGAIRLAVSGIAEKMDFGLDAIEDLKACVSESCLLLLCGQKCDDIFIEITMDERVAVTVTGNGILADTCENGCEDFSAEISRVMIEALADEAVFVEENGLVLGVSFAKKGES